MSRNIQQLKLKCDNPLDDFLFILLSSTKLHDKECKLFTLYQFILTRPVLNVGALLLPKLVDLYWWIHNSLRYRVTSVKAKLSAKTVLESLLDQLYPAEKLMRMNQMDDIISMFYIYYFCDYGLIFAAQYQQYRHFSPCLPEITFDIEFYNLLHMVGESKDILFKAITDIVSQIE